MTYAAAQDLLDDAGAATPVARAVKLLASVARCMRRQRVAAGALALSSPEVKFLLDSETHDPTDVSAYETRETNSTVEEFMLMANCAVAERVTAAFPRCALLRRHPAPPRAARAHHPASVAPRPLPSARAPGSRGYRARVSSVRGTHQADQERVVAPDSAGLCHGQE
jgi:exoribonuclease R